MIFLRTFVAKIILLNAVYRSYAIVPENTGNQNRLEHICLRIANGQPNECPTRSGRCPLKIICNEGNASVDELCDKVGKQGCGVESAECKVTLNKWCGCEKDINCSGFNQGAGGQGGQGGQGNGQGGQGKVENGQRFKNLCRKIVSAKKEDCPTLSGNCPAGPICKVGGRIDDLCQYCEVKDTDFCASSLKSCGCQAEFDC